MFFRIIHARFIATKLIGKIKDPKFRHKENRGFLPALTFQKSPNFAKGPNIFQKL